MGVLGETLFHEPRGTRSSWLPVEGGALLAAVSVAGIVGLLHPDVAWTRFLVLGSALVSMGAAELLDTSRRWPVVVLRAGSLAGFVAYAFLWIAAN